MHCQICGKNFKTKRIFDFIEQKQRCLMLCVSSRYCFIVINIFCKFMNFVYGLPQILVRHCNIIFFLRHNQLAPFILGLKGAPKRCWAPTRNLECSVSKSWSIACNNTPMLCSALSYSDNAKIMQLSLIVTRLDPVENQP